VQVGVAGLVDYCASKHAAVGIDESLRFELRKQKMFGAHSQPTSLFALHVLIHQSRERLSPWLSG
jgi:hypothetical protein